MSWIRACVQYFHFIYIKILWNVKHRINYFFLYLGDELPLSVRISHEKQDKIHSCLEHLFSQVWLGHLWVFFFCRLNYQESLFQIYRKELGIRIERPQSVLPPTLTQFPQFKNGNKYSFSQLTQRIIVMSSILQSWGNHKELYTQELFFFYCLFFMDFQNPLWHFLFNFILNFKKHKDCHRAPLEIYIHNYNL